MSFLTYNWGGDGRDVWPFIHGEARSVHYDVSKLAQWEVVMDHAERLGLFLHIKMSGNFDMFPRRLWWLHAYAALASALSPCT